MSLRCDRELDGARKVMPRMRHPGWNHRGKVTLHAAAFPSACGKKPKKPPAIWFRRSKNQGYRVDGATTSLDAGRTDFLHAIIPRRGFFAWPGHERKQTNRRLLTAAAKNTTFTHSLIFAE